MRSVSVIANLWQLESTGIFCTNDIIYHSLWPHLPSLPYQFLIFEDVEDWQPSPGVGHLPTLGPCTPRLFTGTWFLTWTTNREKDEQLGFLARTNFFFNSEIKSGQCESSMYFLVTAHIRNAGSNPTPLCNGWELLQYTVLIGVIQGLDTVLNRFLSRRWSLIK